MSSWQDINIRLRWNYRYLGRQQTGFNAVVTVGDDFVWDLGLENPSPSQVLRAIADEIDRDPTIYGKLLQRDDPDA